MKFKFIGEEQQYQSEQTVYWFETEDGVFGVVYEMGYEDVVVDADGCPVNLGDAKNVHLADLIDEVTDDMIQDF